MSPGLEPLQCADCLDQLRRNLWREWKRSDAASDLVRAEVEAPDLDAAAWLAAQLPGARGFWSDREQSFVLAGIGRADWLIGDAPAELPRLMQQLHDKLERAGPNIRYFGGFSFDPRARLDAEWKAFGHYRFILPRVEVVSRDGHTVLACNARRDEDPHRLEAELARVRFPTALPSNDGLPMLLDRVDTPAARAWTLVVNEALRQVEQGGFQKVVLARRASFRSAAPLDAAGLLLRLRARPISAFHFCFQPDRDHAFIGASPERLYRRDGRRFSTEAIAGTRPRGASAEEDARLRHALLSSDKDRREHGMVVDGIRDAVAPLLSECRVEASPRVLALTHNQHLLVAFQGTLREGVQDADLLSALHPTPAVGGVPTDEALAFLREREGFCRGWYAAPIGWVSRDAAQFAVGIRSALVSGPMLHLYSGAGIVAGSEPDAEWAEIENKIADFLDLFPAPAAPGSTAIQERE